MQNNYELPGDLDLTPLKSYVTYLVNIIILGEDDDSKITVSELEYAVKECLPCDLTKDVQSVLLRYTSELKQIYNFYR